jgi:hypothetical protein
MGFTAILSRDSQAASMVEGGFRVTLQARLTTPETRNSLIKGCRGGYPEAGSLSTEQDGFPPTVARLCTSFSYFPSDSAEACYP